MGAESGTGKTLAYDAAMLPLVELQRELDAEFEQETGELRATLGMVKKEIEAILANFREVKKAGNQLMQTRKKRLKSGCRPLPDPRAD